MSLIYSQIYLSIRDIYSKFFAICFLQWYFSQYVTHITVKHEYVKVICETYCKWQTLEIFNIGILAKRQRARMQKYRTQYRP